MIPTKEYMNFSFTLSLLFTLFILFTLFRCVISLLWKGLTRVIKFRLIRICLIINSFLGKCLVIGDVVSAGLFVLMFIGCICISLVSIGNRCLLCFLSSFRRFVGSLSLSCLRFLSFYSKLYHKRALLCCSLRRLRTAES